MRTEGGASPIANQSRSREDAELQSHSGDIKEAPYCPFNVLGPATQCHYGAPLRRFSEISRMPQPKCMAWVEQIHNIDCGIEDTDRTCEEIYPGHNTCEGCPRENYRHEIIPGYCKRLLIEVS